MVRRKAGRHRYYRVRGEALKPVQDWTAGLQRNWQASLDRLGDYLDRQA